MDLLSKLVKILGGRQGTHTFDKYDTDNIMNQRSMGNRNAVERKPTNVESSPAMYLYDDSPAKAMDRDAFWDHAGSTSARAANSMLHGILYPEQYGITVQDLVHEKEHSKQFAGKYPQRKYEKDPETLKEMLRLMNEVSHARMDKYQTLTGQDTLSEIMAQLKAYEAMLPAGMQGKQSNLGELFNNDAKALWERYKWEQEGLDAMVR